MKYSNAKNWMEECCTMGQMEIQKTYKRDWNDERRNEFDKLIIWNPKNIIDYHDLVESAPKNEDEFKRLTKADRQLIAVSAKAKEDELMRMQAV